MSRKRMVLQLLGRGELQESIDRNDLEVEDRRVKDSLDRYGPPYQNKPICFTIDKSRAAVKFKHEFTAHDAPSVKWAAYVKVNGVESPLVTGTTEVNAR